MNNTINSRTNGNKVSARSGNTNTLPTKESAQYIADMVLELRNLAKSCNFKTLQGLLEVTYYEAFGMAHQVEIPADEEQRLHAMGQDAVRAATAF